MKKITFDFIFKILVILLLTVILIICYNLSTSISNQSYPSPSKIDRYKEMKNGDILDTESGEVIEQGGYIPPSMR